MAVAPGSQRSLLSNKNNKNAEGTQMFFYAACLHVIIVYICSGGQDPQPHGRFMVCAPDP